MYTNPYNVRQRFRCNMPLTKRHKKSPGIGASMLYCYCFTVKSALSIGLLMLTKLTFIVPFTLLWV